jgi:SecY
MTGDNAGSMQHSMLLNSFRPIAVTLAALVAYRLGEHVPLPGINPAFLSQFAGNDLNRPSALARVSILALGVLPWFSALTLVEFMAILLPESWTRRFATAGHAQPFSRFVIGLALVLTALQGLGIAQAMQAMPNMVTAPGPEFIASAVTTLLAGSAFLIALALVIERQGIGLGFWIMLAVSMLAQLPSHIGLMLLMFTEGMASPAATIAAVASTAAIVTLIVGILEARRRASLTSLGIFIWPLALASLTSGFIVGINSIFMPDGSEDQLAAMAKMLTNEPAGFVIGAVIASLFTARYASREKDWQFFLPAVAVIVAVQVQSIVAEAMTVQPPLAGASLVIVTAVGYVVLMRVRELMLGT